MFQNAFDIHDEAMNNTAMAEQLLRILQERLQEYVREFARKLVVDNAFTIEHLNKWKSESDDDDDRNNMA